MGQTTFATTIGRGTAGASVKYVQELLITQGYLIDKADSIYGNNTEYAVRAFQKEKQIKPTGIVNDETLAALEENNKKFIQGRLSNGTNSGPVNGGSKSDSKSMSFANDAAAIEVAQAKLTSLGYSTRGIDGIYGAGTVEAVKNFQRDHKLKVTGAIDELTKAELAKEPDKPKTYKRKLIMEASAYSIDDVSTGTRTTTGNRLRRGLVAVDTNVIPLGTRLYIEEYGYAIADDTGGYIRGQKIDLAMDTYDQAIQFGRRDVVVYIL